MKPLKGGGKGCFERWDIGDARLRLVDAEPQLFSGHAFRSIVKGVKRRSGRVKLVFNQPDEEGGLGIKKGLRFAAGGRVLLEDQKDRFTGREFSAERGLSSFCSPRCKSGVGTSAGMGLNYMASGMFFKFIGIF